MKIDNNSLKDIIYNSIYNIINETKLFKYLIHRDKYVDMCFNLSYQIFENWCLIRYCTLTNRKLTKEHWKDELSSYLYKIGMNGIKANNSPMSRTKAIRQGFDMGDLFNVSTSLIKSLKRKFNKEDINIDDDILYTIINDFQQSVNDIIFILSYNEGIDDYINRI